MQQMINKTKSKSKFKKKTLLYNGTVKSKSEREYQSLPICLRSREGH